MRDSFSEVLDKSSMKSDFLSAKLSWIFIILMSLRGIGHVGHKSLEN